MGEISVRPVVPIEYPQWDQFVGAVQQGTIFHRSVWVSAIAGAMGFKYSIYGCFLDDEIIGGHILYHSHTKGLFKSGYSTAPMSSFGGLIVNSEKISNKFRGERNINAVVNAVTKTLQSDGFDYVLLELSPGFYDIRPFIWNQWSNTIRYTYILQPGKATLSKLALSFIRRAEKNDIAIETSTDIGSYYTLYAETFNRQGLPPPMTREQMERMYRAIRESSMGDIWVARMPSGEWAAAEIQLIDEKRCYEWSAASDVVLRRNGANYLLQNSILENGVSWGVKECYSYSANIPNLAEFMTQFGPNLSPYFQVKKRQGRLNFINKLLPA